mmetsp:Transcript_29329/g.33752  ORF Transcript_29329/g.33752 Transcript_29329/m.33752 type:complete len:146 (+) Transcript_29329:25-462(+)|eukprot:CAMPEP_0194388848 /NCGR_PEP_ID=MMETSP0174-20130528/100689_1 /TAXON_ID=216777 /ORGANISM="Proboscia alata, Strain PI-D3" /LENGTH=145 /DNA_ID=CAMNT_0039180511 /DNA_START=14 /DNA_END=451 /DNA_ORIENTATION=+
MKHENVPRTALSIKISHARQLQEEASSTTSTSDTGVSLPAIIVSYYDGADDKWLVIDVQLLLGTKPDNLHIQISENGNQLEFSICWSDVILQSLKLLSKYMDQNSQHEYDPSHTVVVRFCAATKQLRESGSNQDVRSDYRIMLPF